MHLVLKQCELSDLFIFQKICVVIPLFLFFFIFFGAFVDAI
jgi:hypothetical protein